MSAALETDSFGRSTLPGMSFFFRDRERLYRWAGLVGSAVAVIGIAFSPPVLFSPWDTLVMRAFAPVCHQISVRSPHIGEIQIALCDRCTGIYLGFLVGVLSMPLVWWGRRGLSRRAPSILLGATMITGIDWIGPVVGLWSNVPISRVLTGGVLGVAAGVLVGVGLLRSHTSLDGRSPNEASPQSAASA